MQSYSSEMFKKISHFRDGMLFKGEILESKEGKLNLHCECEDKKSKDLFSFDLKKEEVKLQTNYLVEDLEAFLKLYQVGLLGNSSEISLVVLKHDDNNIILSFSYRTEIVNRDFEVIFRKFHRNETERLSSIVNDLQKDVHNLQLSVSAPMAWHPLKLLNGCTTDGREPHDAPPSYLYHNGMLCIRGYVKFPSSFRDPKGVVIAQLKKSYFPVDYNKVFKQFSNSDEQLTFFRVDITTTGELYVHNPSPDVAIFLDGMNIMCNSK